MKKITTLASALLLIAGALVSCQKNELVETPLGQGPTSFTAYLEQSTKVTLDGYTPKFEMGDELNVYANNNAQATFEVVEQTESGATFNLKGSWSADPVAPYFVYSGTCQMAFPKKSMIAFPAQTNVLNAESNSISLATLVCMTEDLSNVTLNNASCLLKVVVPEDVKALKVAPVSGSMTSIASVNFSGGSLIIGQKSTTPVAMAFTGNNGDGLSAGTYYIPLFPQTFTGGVRIGVTTDGTEYKWKEKKGDFTFQRNKIYDLGEIANWFPPQPNFAVEDLVSYYEGSFKFGMFNGSIMQSPMTEDGAMKIEASDDASKGNVMFTMFNGNECKIYASFDLVTGEITIPSGASITTVSYSSRTFDRNVVFTLDEATKTTLSCPSQNVICAVSPGVPIYYAIDEMSYTKAAEPCAVSVADFVGTYSGGVSEALMMNGAAMGTQDRTAVPMDFVFEAAENGTNNVVMKAYYGNACNVPGVFDPATMTATFSEGTITGVQGTGSIITPLVLVLSDDFKTLTQQGTVSSQPSGVSFTWVGTLTVLTKTSGGNGGGSEGFTLSLVTLNQWGTTYSVNGVAKEETSGSPTSFSQQGEPALTDTGCNLYMSNFMCSGYNTGYANFDEQNGTLTIPLVRNGGCFYFPAIDWVARNITADIVLQMSDDHNTMVSNSPITLSDGTVLENFTLTKK